MQAQLHQLPTVAAAELYKKCRICACLLNAAEDDDQEHGICSSCKGRPEARRLGVQGMAGPLQLRGFGQPQKLAAREFTAAEKSLIFKVHGFMPSQQLLDLLNERLMCDLGPDAMSYTMDQLYAEIGGAAAVTPSGGHDWPSLRKLLAKAARDGVLKAINDQVINDFAVVYSLNPKQVLALKDIVLQAKEEER